MWTGKEEASQAAGKPDQDLVMVGYMALAGSAVMTRQDRERLLSRLPEELIDQLLVYDSQRQAHKAMLQESALKEAGVSAWFPLGEGGIFNGLWHMADHWGTGFTVQLKDLPVRQETIEVCEIEEKNPYYLHSEGCLLLAANHGDRVCAALGAQGIPAAVIGVLTNKKDKTLCHDSTISCLNRPRQDELDVFFKEHGLNMPE